MEAEEEEEKEHEPDFEPKGTGVNRYTYFVAKDSLSEWIKLPDLEPSHIKASRLIKVLLTGDLERPIFTNPFFDGQEKHYLRAQIARISASTTLIPKGLMRPVEDSETREVEENTPEEGDIVMPSTSAMNALDMWVHANKNILLNGTTSLKQPEPPEGEDWDEDTTNAKMKELLDSDPYAPLLAPICDDSKISVSKTLHQPAWSVKLMGDSTEYKGVSNGVVVVRSLQWPGSYSFYNNGQFQQIYVGNGHKYEQAASFYPIDPPLIEEDPAEFEGPEEPAQNAPVVAEAPAEEEEAPAEDD